jgi:hypothetical protein
MAAAEWNVPDDNLPVLYVLELHSDGYSSVGTADGGDLRDERGADCAERLWHELGGDTSGRPVEVRITVGLDHRATCDVRFDCLPDNETGPMRGWRWENVIHEISKRDPHWIPDWAFQSIALLRAAGRGIPLPAHPELK